MLRSRQVEPRPEHPLAAAMRKVDLFVPLLTGKHFARRPQKAHFQEGAKPRRLSIGHWLTFVRRAIGSSVSFLG
jgi:hypothetical protein